MRDIHITTSNLSGVYNNRSRRWAVWVGKHAMVLLKIWLIHETRNSLAWFHTVKRLLHRKDNVSVDLNLDLRHLKHLLDSKYFEMIGLRKGCAIFIKTESLRRQN